MVEKILDRGRKEERKIRKIFVVQLFVTIYPLVSPLVPCNLSKEPMSSRDTDAFIRRKDTLELGFDASLGYFFEYTRERGYRGVDLSIMRLVNRWRLKNTKEKSINAMVPLGQRILS